MDKQNLANTMRVYDEYEKRFIDARMKKEFYVRNNRVSVLF